MLAWLTGLAGTNLLGGLGSLCVLNSPGTDTGCVYRQLSLDFGFDASKLDRCLKGEGGYFGLNLAYSVGNIIWELDALILGLC
jgi:hypothetical protein